MKDGWRDERMKEWMVHNVFSRVLFNLLYNICYRCQFVYKGKLHPRTTWGLHVRNIFRFQTYFWALTLSLTDNRYYINGIGFDS
jgi:hypothetical protein